MDHREFLQNLEADKKAALTRKSDWRGLWHLLGHVGLLLGMACAIAAEVPFWGLLVLPYGIALIFLFTLEHEATHQTPFANVTLNEWVGRICGVLLILPFEWFRYFHLAHHRFTNDPARDPELAGRKPETWSELCIHVSGAPYWVSAVRTVVRNAFGDARADYVPERALPRIRREARRLVALYLFAAASLFWTDLILWVWVVPCLVGQPFLRVYLLAEHGRCPAVENMFENTRTTFTTAIVRFLAWNMPYHAEHHAYPSVPFWQLPALHKLTRDHLITTAAGYGEFAKEYVGAIGPEEPPSSPKNPRDF